MDTILEVQNLTKHYGKIQALKGVSFGVPKGSIFGILGPNGSGKTTLLGIVMDVLNATSGSFKWLGSTDNAAMRKEIGTLLETPNFYHYLSAKDNLVIAAKIKNRGLDDIENVLRRVNLWERRDSKFNTFSLGMKQRLAIASALLGQPDVLVFDEPTNGLDPAGIAEIRDLLHGLGGEGKTIIMASHILDEVEKVCTHVAIIQKGDLKTVGRVIDVIGNKSESYTTTVEIAAADNVKLKKMLEENPKITQVKELHNALQISGSEIVNAAYINQYCFENGVVLTKLVDRTNTLETKFLEITQKQSG